MRSFSDSLFARLLRRLAHSICRRPRWFIYPQWILAALCLLYAFKGLELDMDRDHLVGEKLKYHQIYLRYEKEFPGGDEMAVVVESGRPELNRRFIEQLAARIEPEKHQFSGLFYKADLTTLGSKALLLFPTNDLADLHEALSQYQPLIESFAAATNFDSLFGLVNAQFRRAGSQNSTHAESLVKAMPGFQQLIAQAQKSMASTMTLTPPGFETLIGGGASAEQQSYITFDHGRFYLLTVRPKTPALATAAITRLRELISLTQTEVPGVNAGLTGSPVLDYDEMRQSEHDSVVASIAALILCSLIFVVGYREVGRPLKTAACLLIGMSYTLGFTTLVVGHLNILTITFAPMLIGLGIDFGIHFITRYEEEMRNRRNPDEAVERALALTGQGIVAGALTTAAAFLAMGFTQFKGIQEMGIISGGGLLLCLVPMLTALPAMLLHGPQNRRDQAIGPSAQARLEIENAWLRHPWWVVGVTLSLCVGAAFQFSQVRFDYNLLHMQSQKLPSVIYEHTMIEKADRSVLFGAVIADSAEQARKYAARLKALPLVSDVESVAGYLDQDQERKLKQARAIKEAVGKIKFAPVDRGPVNVDALSATLWYFSGYLGLGADAAQADAPEVARQLRSLQTTVTDFRVALHTGPLGAQRLALFQQLFLDELRHTFEALRNQDTRGPLQAQDLPAALRNRFMGVSGKYLLQVFPKEDLWQHENQRRFIQQLQSVVPPDRVTGTPVQFYEYTTLLKNSYQTAALYSIVAIVLMLLFEFRSLTAMLLSLLPVAVGAAWLLGFMGLAGVAFNPANIMTLPLVVGIGVTNGIQILNRFAEERQAGILAKSTGKAVLVSGLTALSGFGSLMLAKHQGIWSLGEVMTIGIAACMVAALTLLPALLQILLRRRWKILRYAPEIVG